VKRLPRQKPKKINQCKERNCRLKYQLSPVQLSAKIIGLSEEDLEGRPLNP